MDRINPFDNLHFKQGLGQTQEVASPSKIDGQNTKEQPENIQGVGSLPQSDEDDFVDTSSMIDDTGDFSSSNFDFENEDKTSEIDSAGTKEENGENQNNQNEDDIQEQINNFVSELLEKKEIN